MKFTISQPILSEALRRMRFATSNTANPILGNVLIEAENDYVKLRATNGDIHIDLRLPAAIAKAGTFTLPRERLHAICQQLRGGEVAIYALEGKAVAEISGAGIRAKLHGLPVEDFPLLGADELTPVEFQIPKGFVEMLDRVVMAAAPSNIGRSNCEGVHLVTREGLLVMEAADGKRLHLIKTDISIDKPIDAVIPTAAVKAMIELCGTGEVTALITENSATFVSQDTRFRTKLIDLEFPNTTAWVAFPASDNVVKIPREQLLAAIGHISVIQSDNKSARFVVKKDGVTLRSSAHERGDIESSIECRQDIEGEFALNPAYLKDAIADSTWDDVPLDLGKELGKDPLFIREGDFVAVIAPIGAPQPPKSKN